jgi:hypothetical protein
MLAPGSGSGWIDAGQFDRFRVIAPKTFHQGLNCSVGVLYQAAGVGIPYHALPREKRTQRATQAVLETILISSLKPL